MKRLLATIRCDIQLQARHGFYYASAFFILLWSLLLTSLSSDGLVRMLPALIVNHLVVNTFFFIAGLVLLEKGEGTLLAQSVTPLRSAEYLLSKVATLAGLGVVENVALVLFGFGGGFRVVWLVAGISGTAVLFCLVGFLAVIRYSSINEYMFPAFLYLAVLNIPLMPYAGVGQPWMFYWHPIQAPLILLQAAFTETAVWQIIFALVYTLLWILLLWRVCQQTFHKFVVRAI